MIQSWLILCSIIGFSIIPIWGKPQIEIFMASPFQTTTFTSKSTINFKGTVKGVDRLSINGVNASEHLPYFYYKAPLPKKNTTYIFSVKGSSKKRIVASRNFTVVRVSKGAKRPTQSILTATPSLVTTYKQTIYNSYNQKGWKPMSLQSFKKLAKKAFKSHSDFNISRLKPLIKHVFALKNKRQNLFFFPVLRGHSDLLDVSHQLHFLIGTSPTFTSPLQEYSIIWYNQNLDFLEFQYHQNQQELFLNNTPVTEAEYKSFSKLFTMNVLN